MLDVTRPKINLEQDSKITIDQYRNPYLTKLTIKVLPQYSQINSSKIIAPPFEKPINFSIVQSVPLWRNEKFRLGLLWQQNIRNNYNSSNFGFSSEYYLYKNLTLKSKVLAGSYLICSNEINKTLKVGKKSVILTASHSGFLENKENFYQSCGAGVVFENKLAVSVNKKLGDQMIVRTSYERQLYKGLYLKLNHEADASSIGNNILEASIGYHWGRGVSLWMKSVIEAEKRVPNVSFELQKQVKGNSFVASVEYKNDKSVIYFGYKCTSFNLILPVFGSDSPYLALAGAAAFVWAYFNRPRPKFQKIQKQMSKKTEQLKLISDKANQNYRREELTKGLLINQVFIAQKQILRQFLNERNRERKLTTEQKYRQKIFDCTVSFRFYVQKSQLLLPKGSKISILGTYYEKKQGQEIQIYIKYQKGEQHFQNIFKEEDSIII